ncbi:MAG: hypothetical protein HYZ37_17055 [Candidatus Solibacter usitatus]|nr:hypothetical protein [Candidatus Solibacter usitatus]
MNTSTITKTFLNAAVLIATTGLMAQTPSENKGAWRKFGDANRTASNTEALPAPPAFEEPAASAPAPAGQLTIQAGTFLTIRVNDWLSSDRNQQGDVFMATLVKPVVVDGIVVARRGQTVSGRVMEAQKAGRMSGVSKLGIQLTDLTLADGTQLQVQSQLVSHSAGTSVGRDAGAIAGTTGLGAAIGAAAGGGAGAGIGAAAGALASVIGVMSTRGKATVIPSEAVLTFRVESPVAVLTDRAPQAFRPVEQGDYEKTDRPSRTVVHAPNYGYAPYPYYYYGGFGYYGPRFYGPRFYAGRSFGGHFGRRR